MKFEMTDDRKYSMNQTRDQKRADKKRIKYTSFFVVYCPFCDAYQ